MERNKSRKVAKSENIINFSVQNALTQAKSKRARQDHKDIKQAQVESQSAGQGLKKSEKMHVQAMHNRRKAHDEERE